MQHKNHCSLKRLMLTAVSLIFAATVTALAAASPGTTDLGNTNAVMIANDAGTALATPIVMTANSVTGLGDNTAISTYMTSGSATSPPPTGIGNVAPVENSMNSNNTATTDTGPAVSLASINSMNTGHMRVQTLLKISLNTNNGASIMGKFTGGAGSAALVAIIDDNQVIRL